MIISVEILATTKTASQITAADMARYRATARKRAAQEQQAQLQRADQARAVAREAATLLKEKFGAGRVILFGSLARGDRFHRRSDIDLAVEGVRPQNFWRAWAALDTLGHRFEVDLVDVESASPALRQQIEREGIELPMDRRETHV
jgi:predicted nucleotidyltransferase